MKRINFTKKAVKVLLNIMMPLIAFLLGVLLATCLPEKESTLVRKNQSGGENQIAIRNLPAVRAFEQYLVYIQDKRIEQMWENSSYYRKIVFHDAENMMYDYCLTKKYEVQYIIPIGVGHRFSSKRSEENRLSPERLINEHTFSFYALLRFEDDVCIEGEVDKLKSFHDIELEKICDSDYFEKIFEPVLEEVYDFIDRRFVIDSGEYVKNELKNYMMNMNMKNYIIQDWRFPVLFAKDLQLPLKQKDKSDAALYERLGHSLLSEVVMLEEDGVWKLSRFRAIAVSRW